MIRRKLIGGAGLLLGMFAVIAFAHSAGPDPGYTGAPGDSPNACATAGCHATATKAGPLNAFGGAVTATFSDGGNYTPGKPVTITVTVFDPAKTNQQAYGFQMTARLESDKAKGQAGTFTPGGADMFVLCENNSPRRTTCPTSAPLEFIEHTKPNTAPWTFTWTPPANLTGNVYFYVAGNASNNNGKEDAGDHIYTASFVLHPVLCSAAKPTITSVSSAGDFGAPANFAAGSWLELRGSNLALSTRACAGLANAGCWEGPDFNGSTAPTLLDGVSATVNGLPAAIYFVSPGQVNLQAPDDETNGPAKVVIKNCTTSSDPFSGTLLETAPGLLASAPFKVGGKQYLVAQFSDGTYVGNTNLIQGFPFRPAKPGDLLTIYGVGFGDVDPDIPTGTVVGELNKIRAPLTFAFGQTNATINYAGLAPGFVGLYQFNVFTPTVAAGDQQINVTLGGTPLPQTTFLTVGR